MSAPASVLHVLGSGERHAAGLATSVSHLAENLNREKWRIGAVFLRDDGPVGASLRKSDVIVEAADWTSGLRDIGGLRRFARSVRTFAPQIVHFHAGGRAARIVARSASRAKTIAHYHSLYEESGSRRERSAAGADVVIANSRATAETVTRTSPMVVYQGVNVGPRVPRKADGIFRIGTAARLATVKGIPTLLKAFALAREATAGQALEVRLDIAGDGPERRALEEEILALGLTDSVRLLGWRDDVPRLMQTWDLYVQPSSAEGFGLSVLEAMAAGLPVVASRVGGLAELVEDRVTGMLIEPRDAVAMGDAIGGLIPDPRRCALMGARGRERAMRYFSIEREVRSISEIYERLLA